MTRFNISSTSFQSSALLSSRIATCSKFFRANSLANSGIPTSETYAIMPNKNQTAPPHLDNQTFPAYYANYYAATVRN